MKNRIDMIINTIFSNKVQNITEEELSINNSVNNIVKKSKFSLRKYNIKIDNKTKEIVIKNGKSRLISNGIKLLSSNNPILFLGFAKYYPLLDYKNTHLRERCIYENIDDSLKKYLIPFYGSYKNSIALKYIGIDNKYNLETIINNIIDIHTFYYKKDEIVDIFHLNNNSIKQYKSVKSFVLSMYKSLDNKCIDSKINIEEFIKNIDVYKNKYKSHKTLTHNDISYRNIFMNDKEFYLYDWELASYQNPEHDLIELLSYSINNLDDKEVIRLINLYKDKLYKELNIDYDYKELLLINLKDFISIRLSMLRLASKRLNLEFIDDLINNCNRLYSIIERNI